MKYFLLVVGVALVLKAAGIHDSEAFAICACFGGMSIGSSVTLAFVERVCG